MSDMSFKCWHIAINCDHPSHRRVPPPPGHIEEVDFVDTEPDLSKGDWRNEYRNKGFIFHRDGRITCPECRRANRGVTPRRASGLSDDKPD